MNTGADQETKDCYSGIDDKAIVEILKNNFRKDFQYGIQTNCMTCHALATVEGVGYSTDQYIDMKDMSLFKNQVQLDFAWSIQGNINKNK